ncbi:MAG: helix-turn-helix transcriptional regulator [Pseudomonadota bacterium]
MTVTQFEFRQLRKALNVSRSKMASLLGIQGKYPAKTLSDIEYGGRTAPMAVQKLASYLLQGTQSQTDVLPEYLACQALVGGIDYGIYIRTRYPRFLATAGCHPTKGMPKAAISDNEYLSIMYWIDEPVDDPTAMLTEAAVLVRARDQAVFDDLWAWNEYKKTDEYKKEMAYWKGKYPWYDGED